MKVKQTVDVEAKDGDYINVSILCLVVNGVAAPVLNIWASAKDIINEAISSGETSIGITLIKKDEVKHSSRKEKGEIAEIDKRTGNTEDNGL